MRIPISRWRQCLATVALCASMSFTGIVRADEPPAASAAGAHAEREAAAKARLAEVRAEIARIAEAQKATASQRDAINAKLAEQAGQLSQIANAVRDTEAAIAAQIGRASCRERV